MRHRLPERISAEVLADALRRTPLDYHVIWTGRAAAVQPGSLSSKALACIREIGTPVSLRALLQRAAQLGDPCGLHPDRVRIAVRQHQCAKPAVFLLVRRLASGDYVAVTDIPYAGDFSRRFRAGDIIMDRRGVLAVVGQGVEDEAGTRRRVPA